MLCGVACCTRWPARLVDIDFAFMGELPTSKQACIDSWWAGRGRGAFGQRLNLYTQDMHKLEAVPSTSTSLANGFAMLSKFFPFGKPMLAEVENRLFQELGLAGPEAVVFDDEYICTGGQLAELIAGRDRFNAELRCWVYKVKGAPQGLCCHPYDLASVLVAEEAGVIITDARGKTLDGPLDVTTGLDWIGFANSALQAIIEPKLQAVMVSFEPTGSVLAVFRDYDIDGNGTIKREYLAQLMQELDPNLSADNIEALMSDVPPGHKVSYEEFIKSLF